MFRDLVPPNRSLYGNAFENRPIAALAALAWIDTNDRALAVDATYLQTTYLGAPRPVAYRVIKSP